MRSPCKVEISELQHLSTASSAQIRGSFPNYLRSTSIIPFFLSKARYLRTTSSQVYTRLTACAPPVLRDVLSQRPEILIMFSAYEYQQAAMLSGVSVYGDYLPQMATNNEEVHQPSFLIHLSCLSRQSWFLFELSTFCLYFRSENLLCFSTLLLHRSYAFCSWVVFSWAPSMMLHFALYVFSFSSLKMESSCLWVIFLSRPRGLHGSENLPKSPPSHLLTRTLRSWILGLASPTCSVQTIIVFLLR